MAFFTQEVEQAAIASGYNFSGITIPKSSKEIYTLSYEEFLVPLVKAVQKQQTLIEDLRSQSSKVKSQNEALQVTLTGIQDRLQKLEVLLLKQ